MLGSKRLALLLLLVMHTAACADEGNYTVLLSFTPVQLAGLVDSIEVALIDECASMQDNLGQTSPIVHEQFLLHRTEVLEGIGGVSPRKYGLYAVGIEATRQCRIAAGCKDYRLNAAGKGLLEISLDPIAPVGCVGETNDAGTEHDAGNPDAGSVDAGNMDAYVPLDGGHDAGPPDAGPQVTDAGGGYVTTYLSASEWVWNQVENGWGPIERNMSNGENRTGDGKNPFVIGDVEYTRGIGTHAPSELIVQLNGNCTAFTADVGVDTEVLRGTCDEGICADVTFEVYLDDAKAYASDVILFGDAPTPMEVNLTGANVMRLVVTQVGVHNYKDHGDWANARITCLDGFYGSL